MVIMHFAYIKYVKNRHLYRVSNALNRIRKVTIPAKVIVQNREVEKRNYALMFMYKISKRWTVISKHYTVTVLVLSNLKK